MCRGAGLAAFTTGFKLTAAGAANGFLLGHPALFRFGNKPALAADIAEGAGAGDCFAEAAE